MLIELSPKHFEQHPEALTETLLHEMVHAWCYAKFRDTGHGPRFKRKLRECGLDVDLSRSRQRRSARGIEEALHPSLRAAARSRRSAAIGRASRRAVRAATSVGFDARYPLTIYEIVEMRAVGTTLDVLRAARKGAIW